MIVSAAETLAQRLWNPWLLSVFLLLGLYLSFRTGFFQLFGLPRWVRATFGNLTFSSSGHGLTSFQALATALASTIGTGSIAGVATALTFGGPGAIFWLWLSAFLSMMISYVEKFLSVRYQTQGTDGSLQGGPMYYLRDGLHAPYLAQFFCLICLPATLTGGNLIQASAIADALAPALGVPRLAIGIVLAALTGFVMLGGVQRIAHLATILVPFMAMFYLGSGLLVLVIRADAVPSAIAQIISCACTPSSALSGTAGWSISTAMRYGISRGVFTNEAGLGTSAIAHGAANAAPDEQGMWGIFEVFCSSFFVCTITALVILVSGVFPNSGLTGIPLTILSFQQIFGPSGGWIVTITLVLFAFSSLIGWSYYGQQALRFLVGGNQLLCGYQIVFFFCILVGSIWDSTLLWTLVDLFNALLAFPNLVALLCLAPQATDQLLRQTPRSSSLW